MKISYYNSLQNLELRNKLFKKRLKINAFEYSLDNKSLIYNSINEDLIILNRKA